MADTANNTEIDDAREYSCVICACVSFFHGSERDNLLPFPAALKTSHAK